MEPPNYRKGPGNPHTGAYFKECCRSCANLRDLDEGAACLRYKVLVLLTSTCDSYLLRDWRKWDKFTEEERASLRNVGARPTRVR